ncbi:MAG: hypothetical protein FJY95_01020 [Candidatus Handelsmanbacteria bacterium]|nr:hypothetical protein [Candidatus Handelsmanbacteria bacterium]
MRVALPLLLMTLWAGAAQAGPPLDEDRFIRQSQPHQNLSRSGYERYPLFPLSRPVYNRIGNYVGHGTYLMQWDEIRDRYIDDKMAAGTQILDTPSRSNLFADEAGLAPFGYLSMAQQGWKGRGASFFMGRGPITTYSPLIFYQPDFSGVRLDLSTARNNATFLFSRGGTWGRGFFADFNGNTSGTISMSPVLLYGANWRGKFGTLELGSSFLRQTQSHIKGDRRSLFRGDVPYAELRQPKTLTVRLSDDSPDDRQGVAVYDLQVFVREKETGRVHTGSAQAGPEMVFAAGLQPRVQGRRVADHWEAAGPDEVVDFTFAIPPELGAEAVEVAARVAGDYRIGVRQQHDFANPKTGQVETRSWPSTPALNQINTDFKDNPYTPAPFYTVVRARGNLGGEARMVRFEHAIPSAQTFFGFNGKVEARDLSIEGEVAANPQDFIFPVKGGERVRRQAYAAFLKLRLPLGRAGSAGAEVFSLDPTYGGWYDSRRGGAVFFTDVSGDARAGEKVAGDARTQEYPLYADNDDHDFWPDDVIDDFPYVPKGQFESIEALGSRPESGVYPSLDMDGDRVYDMDLNRNGTGDWLEPFFSYDTDPPDFVYGIDFNNNGVPDFQENDAEPDYPYRRDRRGLHLFFDLGSRPAWLDRLGGGGYRLRQRAGGGQSEALYLRAEAHLHLGGASLRLADDLKRVEDDVPDDVYRFVLTSNSNLFTRFNTSAYLPPPDPLLMRQSLVNTSFAELRYAPWRGLETVNTVKYLINAQTELEDAQGNPIQRTGTLRNFTMVNKAEYNWRPLEAISVVARAKHLLVKWDAGSYNFRYVINDPADTLRVNPEASWSMITPSLKVKYRLTGHTSLEYGQAGLFVPVLRARYVDRAEPSQGYTSNISVLQATVTGVHQGYQVSTNLGLRWELTDYDERAQRPQDRFSTFFLDVIFGL